MRNKRALLSVLVIRSSRIKRRSAPPVSHFIIIYYSENNCKLNKMRKKMLTYVDKLLTIVVNNFRKNQSIKTKYTLTEDAKVHTYN